MINPTGKKLEKLLFKMFDYAIQGVDTYNHNGSMWMIFTDEMKWVVEYTKEQTLWYNYHFFKQEMEMVGLDCVDNKDLIQKWFESRFLNINTVEDTIQNGVKNTFENMLCGGFVEDTIQNGVKNTRFKRHKIEGQVEDTIQNGVEDTIQNGVKNTSITRFKRKTRVEDTIQNGVKRITDDDIVNYKKLEDTIQNGVKETTPSGYLGSIEMKGKVVYQIESPKQNNEVEDTIQNGVKGIENNNNNPHSYHHKWTIDWVVQNGIKEK